MKYFESLGIFMPQGCAERRGNKITGSYGQFTWSKKTLSFLQFLPLNLISPNIHINFPRLISIPLSWKDFILDQSNSLLLISDFVSNSYDGTHLVKNHESKSRTIVPCEQALLFERAKRVSREVLNIWKSYIRNVGWRIIWKKIITVWSQMKNMFHLRWKHGSILFGVSLGIKIRPLDPNSCNLLAFDFMNN